MSFENREGLNQPAHSHNILLLFAHNIWILKSQSGYPVLTTQIADWSYLLFVYVGALCTFLKFSQLSDLHSFTFQDKRHIEDEDMDVGEVGSICLSALEVKTPQKFSQVLKSLHWSVSILQAFFRELF